ncbi:porin [Paraburkholderia sp. Ac-20340]|uniref:porin n=1 Tax=Paraburkholderia sp. Ac-20340 TaxID=2703888 RepID=UPI00197D36E7|nr:porin [Paraburkholderia sp. Ac-20340]MBN3856250.1 porin [Paraburkholderia sp. Ac-20340]
MKKTLILTGVLAVFATSAYAQSTVTLYGSLDAGLVYSNNSGGGSLWAQGSGAMSDNYFGLRGAEDLGGGLKAVFRLESGFDLSSGGYKNGESGFNRQSYVGIESSRYGTLTLGRQYDPMTDYLGPISASGSGYGANLAGHPFDNDNLDQTYSIKNSIKYTSANYQGLQFGGLYGFSNDANGFANGRSWSVGATYGNGPLKVAAGYSQVNNSGSLGASDSAASADVNISAQEQRTYGVGVKYAFGPAEMGFVWTHSQIDGLQGLSSGGSAPLPGMTGMNLHLDNYEINGAYHFSPALSMVGSYTYTDGTVTGSASGNNSPKWHTFMLGTDYAFSKRTDVYAAAVYQHASGSLGYSADGTAIANVAAINTLTPSSTNNQVAATIGLRHRF